MTRHAVIIALTLFTLAITGNNALSPVYQQKVDRVVQKVMQCANIPALGVALVGLDDLSLYVNAYGPEDVNSRVRPNVDTRFCLGDATEAFTAVLLAKLIHENENVTWFTPIEDIVGHRLVLSDRYRSLNLNLKDIFAQRSGYPNMDIVTIAKPYSNGRLTRYLRYVQPVAGFREKFVPNKVLFSLLGDVIRDLGGARWESLIQEHILDPLELNSAMLLGGRSDSDVSNTNVAYPVVFYNNKPQPLSLKSFEGLKLIKESSSLCLSPRDMSKWVRFLMHGKSADGQQLMDMEVLRETFSGVQARGYSDDPSISGYREPDVPVSYIRDQNALGWITGYYRGYKFVSQDGSIPGVQTLATFLPDRNVAVFTSFTGLGGSEGLAAKTLINAFGLDILMRGSTAIDETNVCSHLDRMVNLHNTDDDTTDKHSDVHRTTDRPGERPIEDYVGYFRNYAYGDIAVKYNASSDETITMEYGDAVYRMDPTNHNDTFELSAKGLLWFTTESDSARKNRIIAVFSPDPRDPELRMRDVVISGFNKNGEDVVFSTHPVQPRYEGFYSDCQCDGASAMTSAVSLLLTSLIFSLASLFR